MIISLQIPDTLHVQLKQIAKAEKRSLAFVVRRAVEVWVQKSTPETEQHERSQTN